MDSYCKNYSSVSKPSAALRLHIVKLIISVNLLITGLALISVSANAATTVESNITFSPALRIDNLDWNIAGNPGGTDPDVLSELTWENIYSVQFQLGTEILINKTWYFKGYTNYGYIFAGDNQDSDYAGDNRTMEFSRSENDAGEGSLIDASLSVGMFFQFYDDEARASLSVIPQIGYSVHNQRLKALEGYQTIPAVGTFTNLDSSYETQWDGVWLGVDLRFESSYYSTLFFRYEYHMPDYYAEADWNLRDDLQHPTSFEHMTEGTGNILAIGWRKERDKEWLIGLEFLWQRWTTDAGTSRAFASDGTIYETRLNEVNWQSTAVTFIIGKYFPLF